MKPRVQSHGQHLPSARLFLDDIQAIEDVLAQAARDTTITADDYQFESASQLPDLKKARTHDLQIYAREPLVFTHFERSDIWLYIASDDPTSRGLFEKVKAIILARRRPLAAIFHSTFLSVGSVGLGLVLLSTSLRTGQTYPAVVSAVLLLAATAWCVLGFRDRFHKYSTVVLSYEKDAPGFLSRNADRIIIAILAATFGGIVTYIATTLANSNR